MTLPLLSIKILHEQDVVLARQRARAISELLGFDRNDQARVATAVSEIARNAFQYASGGDVQFLVDGKARPQMFVAKITDSGPGIADLDAILEGRYRSRTGMGLGILGAKRLMELCHIESAPGKGTTVVLGRAIPESAPLVSSAVVARTSEALSRQVPGNPFAEIQQQNQELLLAMDELRRRKEQLEELNSELADTNRGMVALYAELDDRAAHLSRANDLKARFLSNMSHEFRTPLNSILALSRLLLDRSDGELTGEQEKQVGFIRKAAGDLSALVNDLLDLAKIEAGKITVQSVRLDVASLFSALRGMFRPLLMNPSVNLVFDDPQDLPPLDTDETKLSQILRNLVSNALKFTERGEVRVSASLCSNGQAVEFAVADTGIGIASEDQSHVFEEYGQIDSRIQRNVIGTGLGLPLSKRLAELLGGALIVESEPGLGSTFRVRIPLSCSLLSDEELAASVREDVTRFPVLVVEDDAETQRLYEAFLRGSGFQCLQAHSLLEARQILARTRPLAVVLDILLGSENGWAFLVELKSSPATRDIPVLVVTVFRDRRQALLLGATDFCTKPVERRWLLAKLGGIASAAPVSTVLIVDDEEVSRYILKGALADTKYTLLEASGGVEGLLLARERQPDLILLDLIMPDLTGFEVLVQLRQDERTRDIPVIVVTSKSLDRQDLALLCEKTASVVSKGLVSHDVMLPEIRRVLERLAQRPRPGEMSR